MDERFGHRDTDMFSEPTAVYEKRLSQPAPPFNAAALGVFRRNLRSMIDLCRGEGIGLVVVTWPSVIGRDLPKGAPILMLPSLRIWNLPVTAYREWIGRYLTAIREVASAQRADLLDLALTFEGLEEKERHFTDAYHLSGSGNRIVAGELARLLPSLFARMKTRMSQGPRAAF